MPNITSLPLLIKAIKMMWVKDLPLDLMKKLGHSMPSRLKQCITNKGQMTKYSVQLILLCLPSVYLPCKEIHYSAYTCFDYFFGIFKKVNGYL